MLLLQLKIYILHQSFIWKWIRPETYGFCCMENLIIIQDTKNNIHPCRILKISFLISKAVLRSLSFVSGIIFLRWLNEAKRLTEKLGLPKLIWISVDGMASFHSHCEFWLRYGLGKLCFKKKVYFNLLWWLNLKKKFFLISFIALWRHFLIDTSQLAIQVGF